jgi:hypothetical protein
VIPDSFPAVVSISGPTTQLSSASHPFHSQPSQTLNETAIPHARGYALIATPSSHPVPHTHTRNGTQFHCPTTFPNTVGSRVLAGTIPGHYDTPRLSSSRPRRVPLYHGISGERSLRESHAVIAISQAGWGTCDQRLDQAPPRKVLHQGEFELHPRPLVCRSCSYRNVSRQVLPRSLAPRLVDLSLRRGTRGPKILGLEEQGPQERARLEQALHELHCKLGS